MTDFGSSPQIARAPAGVSWLHRLAALVAVLEFLAIVFGALERSGSTNYLAVHFWMVELVLAMSLILAACLTASGCFRYVKTLAFISVIFALADAGAQFTATNPGPPLALGVGEALLAPVVFGLTVSLALFTRTDWRWDEPKVADIAAPSFRQLSVFTTCAVFLIAVLGSLYPQPLSRIAPHLVGGVAAAIGALWMLEIALNKFSQLRALKIGVLIFTELVILQLFLGLVTYSMELNARALARPFPGIRVMSATHAAAGALALAAALFVTFESFKYLAPRQ